MRQLVNNLHQTTVFQPVHLNEPLTKTNSQVVETNKCTGWQRRETTSYLQIKTPIHTSNSSTQCETIQLEGTTSQELHKPSNKAHKY